jgi:hypothetical protein
MTPVVISALVYPGAGQLMQRRWISAVFFLVTFSAILAWSTSRTLKVMQAYYDFAFNFQSATGEAPDAMEIGVPFILSLVVYIANVIDAAWGARRSGRPPPLNAGGPS